jgi:putative ABC transport system ATP-binding protein
VFENTRDSLDGSPKALIDLHHVVKEYRGLGASVIALKGIGLEVRRSEFLVITGKSGAGKTTLVNVVTGLDGPTAGEIWVDGAPVHKMGAERAAAWRGRHVGIVFQTFELLPTLTVLQNVMLPMDLAGLHSMRERRERAMHLLAQMGIAAHARKRPAAVSGGQRQRVAIARAMANDPPILVADEPTGNLDSATTHEVLRVFQELVDRGKTVLLVTHDADVAASATRAITIADGEIVEES